MVWIPFGVVFTLKGKNGTSGTIKFMVFSLIFFFVRFILRLGFLDIDKWLLSVLGYFIGWLLTELFVVVDRWFKHKMQKTI